MHIRPAYPTEFELLINNERSHFNSDIITLAELQKYSTFVLEHNNTIIGHYVCINSENNSYLYSFLINSNVQGKGYSKVLLEHFIKNNTLTKTLHVDIYNTIGINLYKAYNFKIIEKCSNFYENNNSAYLMKLDCNNI